MKLEDYMKETAKHVNRINFRKLEYFKRLESKWVKHGLNPQMYDSISHMVELRKNRKMKATLLRLAFEITSGKRWTEDKNVLSAAAAVDLLVISTYVIDDIIDMQSYRVRDKTTWRKYNVPLAILAGCLQENTARQILRESLISFSNEMLQLKILALFDEIISSINQGQVLNEVMKTYTGYDMYEERSFLMGAIQWQNAALIGAVIGKANEYEQKILRDIGKYYGVAIMAINDLRDLLPLEETEEGNYYMDIKKGLWTYPIIYLFKHGNPEEVAFMTNLLGNKHSNFPELIEGTKLLIRSGAISATLGYINKYRKRAFMLINELKECEGKIILSEFCDSLTKIQVYVEKFKEKFMVS